MKRHVLIGLVAMLCCFFTGGFYILISINGVTEKLEKVTSLHQVEFLRVNLENHIKAVQSDLLLQDTVHARSPSTLSQHITTMESSAHICNSCHHVAETRKQLETLEDATHTYMEASLRYIKIFSDAKLQPIAGIVPEQLQREALSQGERLLDQVNVLSTTSAKRIAERISRIHRDITDTKQLIIALVVLGPLAILFITAFFLRRFTGSIATLVAATEHLEQGNLDYQIQSPLKDEFHLLASAFNNMALSLKNQRQELESLNMRYQTLFESAGDAICIIDIEAEAFGHIVSANQAAARLYGYPGNELTHMNVRELTPDLSLDEFKGRLAQ
ncbi:MAG: PAS domain S-box protein, partial [Desulfuromonadaceae bacterium]